MTPTMLTVEGWSAVLGWLPAGLDLTASAREYGALRRRRGIKSAEDLLRLALIYGATPLSLRTTAAWADAAGVAALSDVALLYRLQGAEAWLGALVGALLAPRLDPPPPAASGWSTLPWSRRPAAGPAPLGACTPPTTWARGASTGSP